MKETPAPRPLCCSVGLDLFKPGLDRVTNILAQMVAFTRGTLPDDLRPDNFVPARSFCALAHFSDYSLYLILLERFFFVPSHIYRRRCQAFAACLPFCSSVPSLSGELVTPSAGPRLRRCPRSFSQAPTVLAYPLSG